MLLAKWEMDNETVIWYVQPSCLTCKQQCNKTRDEIDSRPASGGIVVCQLRTTYGSAPNTVAN